MNTFASRPPLECLPCVALRRRKPSTISVHQKMVVRCLHWVIVHRLRFRMMWELDGLIFEFSEAMKAPKSEYATLFLALSWLVALCSNLHGRAPRYTRFNIMRLWHLSMPFFSELDMPLSIAGRRL